MPNSIDATTIADGGSTRRVARWITWGGPLVLAIALLLHAIVFIHWPTYALQIDVLVYRFGGTRVLDGLDLYSIGRNGEIDDLLFTYTPFAALVFTRWRSSPISPPRSCRSWCSRRYWSIRSGAC